MAYTVVWVEQGIQFCLPYMCWCDAAEHVVWLKSQGITSAYVDIEEMN